LPYRLVAPLVLLTGCVGVVTTTSAPRPAVQPLPAAFSCAPDPGLAAEQAALIGAVNAERQAAGLGTVRANPVLAAAAHGHACDNARQAVLSHTGSDGTRPGQRALRAGYDYRLVAENLGLGFHSAPQAMFYWMRSPGHRDNVLAPQVTDAALGLTVTASGQRAWVLMLGKQR
jgi:uncharacterized protein YkwD